MIYHQLRAARRSIAWTIVGLTPPVTFLWGELHLSGYTFNADGTRNLGHLAKALDPGSTICTLLFLGLPALVIGAGVVGAARLIGAMTAVRLVTISAALGGMLLLVLATLTWRDNHLVPLPLVFAAPLIGAGAAATLAGVSSIVAGVPAGITLRRSVAAAELIDKVALAAGATLALSALAWLASLLMWGLGHPCSCG